MANNRKEQTRKEKEEKEQKRQEQVRDDYIEYVDRINARIANGENDVRAHEELKPLEVIPIELWVRKAKRVIDGTPIEIEVSGDSGETKNQRFKRLGNLRLHNALDAMDLLINLASPQYEASPEELDIMLNALRLKVADIENSFQAQKTEEDKPTTFF